MSDINEKEAQKSPIAEKIFQVDAMVLYIRVSDVFLFAVFFLLVSYNIIIFCLIIFLYFNYIPSILSAIFYFIKFFPALDTSINYV